MMDTDKLTTLNSNIEKLMQAFDIVLKNESVLVDTVFSINRTIEIQGKLLDQLIAVVNHSGELQ